MNGEAKMERKLSIDMLDRELIGLLQKNARMPVSMLAKKLGVARTTIQSRLNRLESEKIISGYRVELGQAFGAPQVRATVLAQIDPHKSGEIMSLLKSMVEVERICTTSGRFDLQIELSTDTTEALDVVLDRIGASKALRSSETLIQLTTKYQRPTR